MNSEKRPYDLVLVVLCLTLATTGDVVGQDQPDVSVMSATELVAEADRLKANGEFGSEAADVFGSRAVELLTGTTEAQPLSADVLGTLGKLAEPALSSLTLEQRQSLQQAITAAEVSAESLHPSYQWLHFQVTLMQESGQNRADIHEAVKQWIDEIGLQNLTVEMTRWCLEQSLPQMTSRKEFSCTWIGLLTPNASGEYRLSVCPFNVNKDIRGQETVRHSLAVTVSDQQVVSATPENWDWNGDAVQLQAGQSMPIRVELSYSTSDNRYGDSPHAILYWEGPGITRQVVPSQVFSTPEGDAGGLTAHYQWTEGAGPQETTRTEPNVEFAWATCQNVAPADPQLVASLSERLFEYCTDPAYIAQQQLPEAERPAHEHVYFRNYFGTEYLSCAQRREFLSLLLENPSLLALADETQILRLYHVLRFGDVEDALDLLGTWLQLKPLGEVKLGEEFFDQNRRFYRTVALYLAVRTPGQDELLKDRYLELEDGRCCVPVAYSLGYTHLMNGRIEEWIAFLSEKLADESLTGDRRATWLLARAHAAELRRSPGSRDYQDEGQLLVGTEWLTEAELVAESPAIRGRVVQEHVAQLAALGQWDDASARLEGREGFEDWRARLSTLKREAEAAADARQAEIDATYLAQLRARQEKAATRGATEEAARLDQLISEVTAASEATE